MDKALNLIGALLAIVLAVVLWRWNAPGASGGASFLALVFAVRGLSPTRGHGPVSAYINGQPGSLDQE